MLVKLKKSIYNFMQGRYGIDTLGDYMIRFGMLLIIINLFVKSAFLSLLILILVIYTYVRILSKNYEKRSRQNEWFLDHTEGFRNKLEGFLRKQSVHARIRRTHRIFVCPGCRQKIKVPKGKGKVVITCPKCRVEFTRKT